MAMLMTLSSDDLIPRDPPIRRIRKVVDDALAELDGEFAAMYSRVGRPSVPPEQLLKATVLMALYSVRSERAFCDRLNYDLLFKWFLDLPIEAKAFDATTFTKNRDGSWTMGSLTGSSPQWSARRSCADICRAITSASTARCQRRGRRTRASSPPTAPGPMPRRRAATARSASRASPSNQTHQPTTDPDAGNTTPRSACSLPATGGSRTSVWVVEQCDGDATLVEQRAEHAGCVAQGHGGEALVADGQRCGAIAEAVGQNIRASEVSYLKRQNSRRRIGGRRRLVSSVGHVISS
jgi:Transposase domain (DUF772)